jgi:2-keto-4-pentenoate hydratase
LPASGVLASGAVLSGPFWRWRGMEVEAALRLGQDLLPQGRLLTREELAPTFDAVLPALEVIESRYTDFTSADPMANLADLGCHGALIVGAPMDMAPAALDLLQIDAALHFDGQPATQALGGQCRARCVAHVGLAGPALRAARHTAAQGADRDHGLVHHTAAG